MWAHLVSLFGLLAVKRAAALELYGTSFGVPGVNASYDYVVVGGGTAGLTIAARLAEAGHEVAVLEAGSFYQLDNGNGSVISGAATTQFVGSDVDITQPLIDWNFDTIPQQGAGGRRLRYSRGKCLGGSSARNYLAYHRGTVGSHQKWAKEVGDDSWTWQNVFPFYQRSAHLSPPNAAVRFKNSSVEYDHEAFNNSLGYHQPLQVGWQNWATPLASWVQKAFTAVGIATDPAGFNSGTLDGASWCPSTIDPAQRRSSSQTSFLDYALGTTSLKVYTHAMARQILVSDNNTARGVLVNSGSYNFTLSAKKEVIVSAGAFQSPQLLMVSGIGARDTLQQYGIPVRKHLPGVGQNLWDQPFFGISYRVNVETGSRLANDPVYAAKAAEQFKNNATGPLTGSPKLLAFERISRSSPELLSNRTISALREGFPRDWPEAEYLVINGYVGYNRNYRTHDPNDGYNYAGLASALVSPFSKGNISISSADASVPPVVNPNWLTTPEDQDIAVASFKRLRQIAAHMKDVIIGEEYLPGPNVTTDEQILGFISESMIQIYHAAATCKMGRSSDSMAVIDPKARVYGVSGLRVVDAASFPFLPPGHPQSVVYMLAEKIADDIINSR